MYLNHLTVPSVCLFLHGISLQSEVIADVSTAMVLQHNAHCLSKAIPCKIQLRQFKDVTYLLRRKREAGGNSGTYGHVISLS